MKKAPAAGMLVMGMALSPLASAGWSMFGDAEHFRWAEQTQPGVTETGPRFGLGLAWSQDKPAGWRFGYRGRLYFGSVDYQGSNLFDPSLALSGTTDYSGIVNEALLTYPLPGNAFGTEFVGGLGWDYWNRQLSPDQREQYWVASLRLGLNFDRRAAQGWFGGGGLKYPFYAREDAHLSEIGFSANPLLEPKGQLSFYAEAGYRFSSRWSLSGYYDTYRFRESDPTPLLTNPFAPPGDSCLTGCRLVQPASRVDTLGVRLHYGF